MHIPGCQKNGAFLIGIQKNRAIHILFVEKKGSNHIPGSAEKMGAIRHAHLYYAIYRKFPCRPPPTPPPPPPLPPSRSLMNRTTKRTIVQCTCDQQKLRSVCASTHYIKQASWMVRSPKKVHTVRSAKDLIRMRCYSHTVYTASDSPAIEGKYDQDKICISYKLSPLHEMKILFSW